jgi:hypothetical protein
MLLQMIPKNGVITPEQILKYICYGNPNGFVFLTQVNILYAFIIIIIIVVNYEDLDLLNQQRYTFASSIEPC